MGRSITNVTPAQAGVSRGSSVAPGHQEPPACAGVKEIESYGRAIGGETPAVAGVTVEAVDQSRAIPITDNCRP